MFCRKCGNKLSDDDAFCSKCGAKVVKSSTPPTVNAPAAARSESATRNWLNHPVVRFFLYFAIFVAITILLYAMILPSSSLLMKFIDDPRGLTAIVFSSLGAGLGLSIFSVPIFPKGCRLKAFFLIALMYEISTVLFGSKISNNFEFQTGLIIVAVIIGAVMRYTSEKRK